ncbi:MAG: fumarylacetoacetate hydrolase family protein [Myxococcaceae bacterium]|nr:fumarylacetoacetate hydrolase family protein [Myxococcaceae bacterium]
MQRFGRIETPSGPRFVELEGERVHVLADAPWTTPHRTGEVMPLGGVRWLVPTTASKVVAIGQNYRKHAEEMGKPVPAEPLIFMKPMTALNAHGAPILLPPASQEVHHEAELALVIGRTLTRATEAEAAKAIFAATCFNDVTARDVQRREAQHTRAKSYDTFACCGPWMVRGLDVSDLLVTCRLNGELKQSGRTSDMVHAPAKLVSFISHVMTLLPGDVVSTGTPSGVGPMNDGDVVEVEIEGLGVLSNPVRR